MFRLDPQTRKLKSGLGVQIPYDLEDYEAAKAADPEFYRAADSTGGTRDTPIDEANIRIMMAELKDKYAPLIELQKKWGKTSALRVCRRGDGSSAPPGVTGLGSRGPAFTPVMYYLIAQEDKYCVTPHQDQHGSQPAGCDKQVGNAIAMVIMRCEFYII